MSSRLWAAVISVVVLGCFPASHAAQPTRSVSNNTVFSPRDPRVKITVPGSVRYVGTDRFVLSDPNLGKFDDCELFSFVDADADRHVRKFYWIQFEAYLP